MSAEETRDEDAAARVRRIDELCDRFEDEWRAGGHRSAQEYLGALGLDPAAEPELFRELVKLEETYRGHPSRLAGASPERFAPGALLADRYRIVGPLGKGGMGEVYRADDLTLGQPVALKFLPVQIANDPDRLARFRKEVAAARRVSHPNVCRVYDIAQHQGQSFLTMGFIDGEDLSSVLKRLGRVPEEKGVEIARELCSALAAVHDEGLLHRDLKPANVMLDGRGKVRLTDFGLAAAAEELSATEVRSGTPLYQAPEQLSGKEVTARSDIYALGLVLYELFTGRRAFADEKRDSSPSKPSTHVSGLSPAVERTILRCLEADPANRPRTATEVLAGLPGGDPLAAALAAGETPSPQVVAESGGEGSISPRIGLMWFGISLTCALLAAWLNDSNALFRQAPADLSPRELTVRARAHLKQLGYDPTAGDSAHAISTDEWLLKYLRREHPGALDRSAPKSGQPAVMYFWYRHSPQPLAQRLAANDTSGWSMPGRVLPNEPPLREPGMTCVFLDLEGRLLELHAVPPAAPPDAPAREPDPKELLAAAGFTEGTLRASKELRRVPPVFADKQLAWDGAHPAAPEVPVHVEAAFYRGTPVYFHVGARGQPDRLPAFMPDNPMEKRQEAINMILGMIALPIGGWFAWRNSKLRRAHPTGAAVVAALFVGLGLAGWGLAAKHVPKPADELSMFTGAFGRALFDGLLLWLAYLALEPWVRRTKPWRLVGWNRLLEGKWRDPLVGRDVLRGVGTAAAVVAVLQLAMFLPTVFGRAPENRLVWNATFTEGSGSLLVTVQIAIMVALRHFFMFYLVLLVCRREWLTSLVIVALWSAFYPHAGDYSPVRWSMSVAFAVVSVLIILRAGPLAFVVFEVAFEVLVYMPVTTDFTAWYAPVSNMSLLVVVGLAVYGFWAACRRGKIDERSGS
jgi:hypothetical protein